MINLIGTTGGATIDQSGASGLLKFTSNLTATVNGAKTLTLTGSSAGTGEIAGAIVNSSVGATALTKSGTGTWTLSGANTYRGGTTINGGTLIASHDGALGTGNVSLTASSVTLTLQSGATNNYISDNASISIVTGATGNLDFALGQTDVVGGITLGGVLQTLPGTYGSTASGADHPFDAFFTGLGTLDLVPEPATYMLLGVGLLVCAQRLRRKR